MMLKLRLPGPQKMVNKERSEFFTFQIAYNKGANETAPKSRLVCVLVVRKQQK